MKKMINILLVEDNPGTYCPNKEVSKEGKAQNTDAVMDGEQVLFFWKATVAECRDARYYFTGP